MHTTVYAAQNALKTALSALSGLDNARVTLGHPASLEKDEVWVSGEVQDWQLEYRQSGLVARDEFYTLIVYCFASRTGKDFEGVRDRVAGYSTAVEDYLADNPTLGGTVMLATVISATLDEGISQDGRTRMAMQTLNVRCRAHVDAG